MDRFSLTSNLLQSTQTT